MAKFSAIKAVRRLFVAAAVAATVTGVSSLLPSNNGLFSQTIGIQAAHATAYPANWNLSVGEVNHWVQAHEEGWVYNLYGSAARQQAGYVKTLLDKIASGQQLTEADINGVNWSLLDKTNSHDLPWANKWVKIKGILYSNVGRPAPQISPAELNAALTANNEAIAQQEQSQQQQQEQYASAVSEANNYVKTAAEQNTQVTTGDVENHLNSKNYNLLNPQMISRIATQAVATGGNATVENVGNGNGAVVDIDGDRIEETNLNINRQVVQPGAPAPGNTCRAFLGLGQLQTDLQAGMQTRAGSSFNVDGTVSGNTVSAGLGFGRTGSSEGFTAEECARMQEATRRTQSAVADQLTAPGFSINQILLPVPAPGTIINNTPTATAEQEQRQWIQDGQTGSFQR